MSVAKMVAYNNIVLFYGFLLSVINWNALVYTQAAELSAYKVLVYIIVHELYTQYTVLYTLHVGVG